MNKKRILIIDGPLGGGGAERVLIDILRNMDYSRYDVDLALICRGGALMDEVPSEVNIIELWNGYSLSYKLAYRMSKWLHCNFLFSRKMNSRKLHRDYDLEISFLEGMPLKLGALRTTKAKKATWVHCDIYTHRYEEAQFFSGEELHAYNSMDYVVNVSKDSEDAFRRRFPDCKAELHVIYNPIDRAKIEQMAQASDAAHLNKREGIIEVVTVGRLTPPKKPTRLLELAAEAYRRNLPLHFTWVGDGELRDEIIAKRDSLGLQNMVDFRGFMKNPFGIIADADIMLVTSDYEGFCLVICEAMCLGVPVISTPTAGPKEIIGDNKYGCITDFTVESLIKTLEEWTYNPELRKKYALVAQNRPNDFSVDKTIRGLETLI